MSATRFVYMRRRQRRRQARVPERRRSLSLLLTGVLLLAAPIILGVAVISATAVTVAAFTTFDQQVADLERTEHLVAALPGGGARVYDRHGRLLYEFVDPVHGQRRPISLDLMSPWLIDATIAVEDHGYYDNPGINYRGLARAAYENLWPNDEIGFMQGSGGSSITQQLAKNLYIPAEQRTVRSIDRKAREVLIALELTRRYSKDQILEWYLNTAPYGGAYVGVEAAAQGYFAKSARDLTLAEAALLAGMPQSPVSYDPIRQPYLAQARQRAVLDLMVRHDAITRAQADQALDEQIEFREATFPIHAPHFVLGRVADEIRQRYGEDALYRGGLEVVTTLDLSVQHVAERLLEEHIAQHEATTNARNGAVIVMEPATGEVLAYVGSRNYWDGSIQGQNDNIVALNSPGSALKPFTYLATFEQGWETGTTIPDRPMQMRDPGSDQIYVPRNAGDRYFGTVTAAQALGNSLNVPAVHAVLFLGVDEMVSMLHRAGFTTLDPSRGYGPAITVGGVDVTLEDNALAYSMLANGGVLRGQATVYDRPDYLRPIDPVLLRRVNGPGGRLLHRFESPDTHRVVSEPLAYLVTEALADPQNQCLAWAFCGRLALSNGMPAAVKTGTSQPYEGSEAIGDTWSMGYTTDLVIGVWIGNADNAPLRNIFSTTVAWSAWHDLMIEVHDLLGLQPRDFERPDGVIERNLCRTVHVPAPVPAWPSEPDADGEVQEAQEHPLVIAQQRCHRSLYVPAE